jgi:hypothetical protein
VEASAQDALGRFHRALVEEILRTRPLYLSEPFTVSEIYQNLVPYRTHRDRIGVAMNGDYEDVLLRLLAGEGEYLVLESEHARKEIEQELKAQSPNTGLYREYAAVDVRLNPLRMPRDLPDPAAVVARAGPHAKHGEALGIPAPALPTPSAPKPPSQAAPAEPIGDDLPLLAARAAPEPPPPAPETPSNCLWCREPLPRREMLNYCPFCGADLHKAPCPNCGEELEVGWRFCVACGTGVDDRA